MALVEMASPAFSGCSDFSEDHALLKTTIFCVFGFTGHEKAVK